MRRTLIKRLATSNRVERLVNSSPVTDELLINYVAGEHRSDALEVVDDLIWKGLSTSVTFLAQPAETVSEAAEVTNEYLWLLDALTPRQLGDHAELSIKLSTIGRGINGNGDELALNNAAALCRAARNAGIEITIEAEEAATVRSTLAIVNELRSDFPGLGIAIQAMLYRSEDDCITMAEGGGRVRLCKGQYRESSTIAHTDRHAIDLAFVRCLRILMEGDGYPMIATHDPRLVRIAQRLASNSGRSPDTWEMQMIHGVRPLEQRRISDIGQHMRVYVPYGNDWYPYYVQALAERPDNIKLFLRSLLGRR